jgi:DNA mismatch repair protein MutL
MAHPGVGFTLAEDGRSLLRLAPSEGELFAARLKRLGAVMSREFSDNALGVDAEREGIRLTGYIGLPTLNRGNAQHQYLFVNGRPVRDKLLHGAVRGAYQDFLARDRHPMLALFLELPPEQVDINVHPAKAEVRFREPGLVRGLIVGACRHALAAAGHRASTTVAEAALGALRPQSAPPGGYAWPQGGAATRPRGMAEAAASYHAPLPELGAAPAARPAGAVAAVSGPAGDQAYPLGAARAQVHGTYVVAQTDDGIVIVDQHAAHERLVYERMKRELAENGVARQILLIPEVVELDEPAAERLVARAGELAELGLAIEPFGPGAVVAREVPALLGEANIQGARSGRRAGGAGRGAGPARAPGGGLRHHGLPRLGARRPATQFRGDERAAAGDGGDAPFGPMQPRPADLRGAQAGRYREAFRPPIERLNSG